MRIVRHNNFRKNFKKRISNNPKLIKRFEQRLKMFLADKNDPLLKDHKLIGTKRDYRAFSVTGDIRLVYRIVGNSIELYDIGTHNQVY